MSVKEISEILGTDYICSQARSGSFKIELAALKTKGNPLNLLQKADLFRTAQALLIKNGYDVSNEGIREGWRNAAKEFIPWPHMWVNSQTVEAKQGLTPAQLAEAIALLKAQGVIPQTDTDGDGIIEDLQEDESPL